MEDGADLGADYVTGIEDGDAHLTVTGKMDFREVRQGILLVSSLFGCLLLGSRRSGGGVIITVGSGVRLALAGLWGRLFGGLDVSRCQLWELCHGNGFCRR